MLYETVGASFTADATSVYAGDLPTGLVGSITAGIYTAPYPGGTEVVAPSTTGIIELAGPTYRATLTVNTPVPSGVVRFVIPAQGLLPQQIAEEEIVISPPVTGTAATDVLAGDGITRDAYETGSIVRLTFQIFEFGGVPVDPLTLTLKIVDPTGQSVIRTLGDPLLIRDSAGVFHIDILVTTPRTWGWRVDTTGPTAGTGGLEFYVLPSQVP